MSEDDLETAPTIAEALKLPIDDYLKIAQIIFQHKDHCQLQIAENFEKFYEWCIAMNCVQSAQNCRIPQHPHATTISSTSFVMTSPWSTTTQSYVDMINSAGHNGSCFDEYYCTQQSMAVSLHYLFGIVGFIFCLFGILLNLLFLPAFNVVSNRTGSTLYLTAMTFFDCLYLTLFTIIVVIRHIPYDYIQQLEMYARFSAYLIPHGLPTMQLMELLSVWVTVALLVDRFLYLKFGFHSKIICSRKLSLKIVTTIVVLLITYTIPKYLEYQLTVHPKFGIVKVTYTAVGASDSFQNLLLHWLKVPVEMFLPYLAVAIFSVLNSIKLYDLMFKRKLSEASKERKQKNDDLEEDNIQFYVESQQLEKHQKFPSLAINSKIPIIASSLKAMEDKENAIVIVTLLLGFSLLLLKIPKFILHAINSEGYVAQSFTKFFLPITDFLDLIWIVSKPIMFAVAIHFRSAVLSVFCCKPIGKDAIIEVLPANEMGDLATTYIANVRNSLEEKEYERSNLMETDCEAVCLGDEVALTFSVDDALLRKNDSEINA